MRIEACLAANRERTVTAVLTGIGTAVLCTIWAVLVVLVRGPDVLTQLGLPLWGLVLAYLVGGAFGGLLVGLLWRLGGSLLRAVVIGYVAALPFFAAGSLF